MMTLYSLNDSPAFQATTVNVCDLLLSIAGHKFTVVGVFGAGRAPLRRKKVGDQNRLSTETSVGEPPCETEGCRMGGRFQSK